MYISLEWKIYKSMKNLKTFDSLNEGTSDAAWKAIDALWADFNALHFLMDEGILKSDGTLNTDDQEKGDVYKVSDINTAMGIKKFNSMKEVTGLYDKVMTQMKKISGK